MSKSQVWNLFLIATSGNRCRTGSSFPVVGAPHLSSGRPAQTGLGLPRSLLGKTPTPFHQPSECAVGQETQPAFDPCSPMRRPASQGIDQLCPRFTAGAAGEKMRTVDVIPLSNCLL